jgi:predicted nucleic acid-binding protein
MPAKVFIDTNIVIYALGPASTKTPQVSPLFVGNPSISTQVLSEAANVAAKKLAMPIGEIRKLLLTLESMCRVEIIVPSTLKLALDISERYGFSWYDSLIVSTALEAGCEILYTEDLRNGQIINGSLTITNPFMV